MMQVTPGHPGNWARNGKCVTAPEPGIFFRNDPISLSRCHAMCSTCPVVSECGEYALAHEEHGFWGGMSEQDRRIERSRRGREARRQNA